jgi:hypothetical protein
MYVEIKIEFSFITMFNNIGEIKKGNLEFNRNCLFKKLIKNLFID